MSKLVVVKNLKFTCITYPNFGLPADADDLHTSVIFPSHSPHHGLTTHAKLNEKDLLVKYEAMIRNTFMHQ